MEREENSDLDEEDIEDMEEEEKEDMLEDSMELSDEMQDMYGSPSPEPKYNQHVFLSKAAFDSKDTLRTTYLTQYELGRPLFTIRFLLDLYKMAEHDDLHIIADYFKEKIQNITHSGMSYQGFAMNLNVTQKRDMTKKKSRDSSFIQPKSEKGGMK